MGGCMYEWMHAEVFPLQNRLPCKLCTTVWEDIGVAEAPELRCCSLVLALRQYPTCWSEGNHRHQRGYYCVTEYWPISGEQRWSLTLSSDSETSFSNINITLVLLLAHNRAKCIYNPAAWYRYRLFPGIRWYYLCIPDMLWWF